MGNILQPHYQYIGGGIFKKNVRSQRIFGFSIFRDVMLVC